MLLDTYGDDMTRGSDHVDALFGYHQPARIILSENPQVNAMYTGFGTIVMNSGIFDVAESENLFRGRIIEEVMEHEQFHYRDHQYHISESDAVRLAFASASPEVLQELNESAFTTGGFGGHAEDNEKEFVATLLNTIDDANWEEKIHTLSPAARIVYAEGLMAARDQIEAFAKKFDQETPPIVSLLTERIDALDEQRPEL